VTREKKRKIYNKRKGTWGMVDGKERKGHGR
jgi:hypothetical protein